MTDQAATGGSCTSRPDCSRQTTIKSSGLIVLCFLIASCSPHRTSPRPLLASFDRLKPKFEQIDEASHQVAVDLQELNRSMQADDSEQARRRSDLLATHAVGLRTLASGTATTIRSLARRERNRTVHTYFEMLLGVLSRQSSEGTTLQQLAHLTWHDPLITNPPDEQRLSRLVAAARRQAQQAVTLAARASAWRRRYRSQFRYSVPSSAT